jgi:exopolysaccharide biosynthesis polyprenyl glycosylphosphotransferase
MSDRIQVENLSAHPPRLMTPRLGSDRYLLPLVVLALADAVVFAASVWLAYPLRFHSPVAILFPLEQGWDVPPFGPFFKFGMLAAVIGVVVFERLGFYQSRIGMDRHVHILRILFGVIVTNLILQGILSFTETPMSLGTRLVAATLTVPLAVIAHYAVKRAHHEMLFLGGLYKRTLVIARSVSEISEGFDNLIRGHGSEFQVTGVLVKDIESNGEPTQRYPVMGEIVDLRRTLATGDYDAVLILLREEDLDQVHYCTDISDRFRIPFFLPPDLFESVLERTPIGGDVLMPVLTMGETPLSGSALVVKRLFDIFGSLALIGLCLPFWAVIALLIKKESPGPILFKQERVGHDGRTFHCLKFRSMRVDAEAETGPVWAVKDDPRRTRIGTWMRENNVDETPQFLNVLRGEMSLVGPRPERPHFVNQFKEQIPSYLKRHMVKSGITGWAQVNGLRGDTSIEERTRYDMWYIQNWSLRLDIRILFRTLSSKENAD